MYGGIHGNVFKDGPETPGACINFGLRFGRKVDYLGVTPSLKIEHAFVRPTVLIVTDEKPLRVRRESRFSGARKPEKYRHIVRVVFAHIRRAVHGKHVPCRQKKIERRKDRFLDLPRIGRSPYENQFPADMNSHKGPAPGSVFIGVRMKIGTLKHRKGGHKNS